MTRRTATLLVALAGSLLTGCGSGSTPAASSAPAAASAPSAGPSKPAAEGGTTYTVSGYAFPALSVAPGAVITLVDGDAEAHTVTADDGTFDSGTFDGTASGSLTAPTKPGRYPFHCTVHPSMHGVLVVG